MVVLLFSFEHVEFPIEISVGQMVDVTVIGDAVVKIDKFSVIRAEAASAGARLIVFSQSFIFELVEVFLLVRWRRHTIHRIHRHF